MPSSFLEEPAVYMSESIGGMDRAPLENLRASSTLPPQGKNRYEAKRMSDRNHKTAWVEGDAEYGVGESITFT